MEDINHNRQRILEVSKELFYNRGYNRVTMDDIARNLSMSKKTLYRHFNGKYDIMKTLVEETKKELSSGVLQIVNDSQMEYPLKLKKMLNFVAVKINDISNKLMEDMRVNLPELWEDLNNYKNESAYQRFALLIEEGKKKEMINDRINHRLVVVLYANAIQNLLDPLFLNQLPKDIMNEIPHKPAEIFDNLINIIYEGILTEEAKKEYQAIE